jgi:hypothetical protein
MHSRLLLIGSILLTLNGCVSIPATPDSEKSNIEQIEDSISSKNYEAAYRLSEGRFPHSAKDHDSVMTLFKTHPEILVAGRGTFTKESYNEILDAWNYNKDKVAKIELERLMYFKLVAKESSFKEATASYNEFFKEYVEEIELKRKKHAEDLITLKEEEQAAFRGDSIAQFSLGKRYRKGLGVTASKEKAFYWIKNSAEQGNFYAQFELGSIYITGRGVLKDYKQALVWYKKSAEQGYAAAQHSLGYMFLKCQTSTSLAGWRQLTWPVL